MAWSQDGLYLCTVSEGGVYTWFMDGYVRVQESVAKSFINNCVALTPNFRTLVVGDNMQGLRIFNTNRKVTEVRVQPSRYD